MTRLWTEEKLNRINKKKGDLASALGITPSRISDIIKGSRRVQMGEITSLSEFLEMDVSTTLFLLNAENSPADLTRYGKTESITVIGKLNKSEPRYILWPQEQQYLITLPKQSIYARTPKFAVEELKQPSSRVTLHICISHKDIKPANDKTARVVPAPANTLSQVYNTPSCSNPLTHKAVIIASYHQH